MKTALLAVLMFGLGVYVGRPAQIVVDAQKLRDCTIIKTEFVQAEPPLLIVPNTPKTPEIATSPSPTPDEPKRDDVVVQKAPALDDDEKPVEDPKAWALAAAKDAAKSVVQMQGWPTGFTFTAEEYKHIDELRQALIAQNLQIISEEPLNIGKYVWKMKVAGPDYRAPTAE